jgi:hypothetical protein
MLRQQELGETNAENQPENLPLEDRLLHKIFKKRQSAFEEFKELLEKSNEDEFFERFSLEW